MEVEITSREELLAWLEGRPSEWSQLIALRSTLRVIPFVCDVDLYPDRRVDARLPLMTLRAISILFGGRKYAADVIGLIHAATAASNSAAGAVNNDAKNDENPYRVYSAVSAAAIAVRAVAVIAPEAPDASAASATASTAHAAATNEKAIWDAIDGDCRALQSEITPEALEITHLWRTTHKWFQESWVRAARWLSRPQDGFAIWREWYYGRLEGLPNAFAGFDDAADEKFYRWIIEQDDNWWSRAPAEVNAEITAFVDALRLSNKSPKASKGTPIKKAEAEQLNLQSIVSRLTASETSTQILAAEDIPKLKAALKETREASLYARDELDRPSIGHNSGAFADVGPVDGLTIPADSVSKIGEQLKAIEARLLALQEDLEKPQPMKGEIAKQGKGIAERLDAIRKISPEFFKGFESQLGKGLAIGLAAGVSAGVALLFTKLPSLLHLLVSAVGG